MQAVVLLPDGFKPVLGFGEGADRVEAGDEAARFQVGEEAGGAVGAVFREEGVIGQFVVGGGAGWGQH